MELLTNRLNARVQYLNALNDAIRSNCKQRQVDVYAPTHFENYGDYRKWQRKHLRMVNGKDYIIPFLYEQLRFQYQVTWDMS